MVLKILDLLLLDNVPTKSMCIRRSTENGTRQTYLFTFVLGEPSRSIFIREPDARHLKEMKQSFMRNNAFYLGKENIR